MGCLALPISIFAQENTSKQAHKNTSSKLEENMETYKVVYGKFEDNVIILEEKEVIECTTYASVSDIITGIYGFHQLVYSDSIECYIITNFVEYPLEQFKAL